MSICHFTDPACPHCRARNGFPPDQRRKWDALVRAFQIMPWDATAHMLVDQANTTLKRSKRLEAEAAAAVPFHRPGRSLQ